MKQLASSVAFPGRNTYDKMFSRQSLPEMPEGTRAQQHKLMLKVKRWLVANNCTGGGTLDMSLGMIMNKIMLFSTEGLELNDPHEAERVREGYCSLLWRYLEATKRRAASTRKDLAARFGEGLMIESAVKEILGISERERKRNSLI